MKPSRNLFFLIRQILSALFTLVLLAGCATPLPVPTQPTIQPLPRSFKGYELYSWQVNSDWHFTLVTGTNRNKTTAEITAAGREITADGWVRLHVTGTAELKAILSALPAGEEIFWTGLPGTATSTRPPQASIDEVKAYASTLGVKISGPFP